MQRNRQSIVNQKLHFYLGRLAVVATLCTVLITGMARSTSALASENAWTIGWGGIGNDGGVIAQPLADGSIITISNVDAGTLAKKFDTNGVLQWSIPVDNIGATGVLTAESSVLLPDGRALFFGYVEQNPVGQPQVFDAELIAISTDGVATLITQFGGPSSEFVKSVGICSDGSFFVGGTVWGGSVDPGNTAVVGMVDLYLAKYDSSFNRQWIKQFGSTNNDALFSVSCGSNNLATVSAWGAGAMNGQGSNDYYNFYVIKYGATGNLISTVETERDPGYWSPQNGVAGPDGSMYVVGEHNSRNLGSVPCTQQALGGSFITKYNNSGDLVWRQIIDCGNYNRRVAVDAWGNVYVVGGAGNIRVAGQQKFGGEDILLHKYSADGVRLWTRQFGSADDEYGNSLAIDTDGNVFIGVQGRGLFDGYQPVNEWDAILLKNRVGETGVKATPPEIPVTTTSAPVTTTSTTTTTTSTTTIPATTITIAATTTTVTPISEAAIQTTTTTGAPVITPTTASANTTVTTTTVTIPLAAAQSIREAPRVAPPAITTSIAPQKIRLVRTHSNINVSWQKPNWNVHHVLVYVDEQLVKRVKKSTTSTKISRVKKGQHRFTVVFVDQDSNWFSSTTKMSPK
jgi:hypothetical protein